MLRFPERVWQQQPNGLWRSRCLEPIKDEPLNVMDKEHARREALQRWWADHESPPADRDPITLRFVAHFLDEQFPN